MSEKKYDIIGVGSPIIDSLARIDDDYLSQKVEGAKGGMELVDTHTIKEMMLDLISKGLVEAPGGSAGNTVFAMSKLGVPSTFLGKIGNCEGAEFYKNAFAANGGDTSRFKVGEVANGRCLSLITPDYERTMRTDLGAAMTLSPDEVSAADFADCRHAHIEGYLLFNRDLLYKVISSAKDAGCTTSLDLASFEVVNAAKDILPDLLKNDIDVVFANEEEANAFSGKGDAYEDMARELAELCEVGVVKVGKDGSFVARGSDVVKVDPILAPNAIDTTAAGDFWAAGFLYGWLKGAELGDCGRYGSRLGCEVVQAIGSVLEDDAWARIRQEVGA